MTVDLYYAKERMIKMIAKITRKLIKSLIEKQSSIEEIVDSNEAHEELRELERLAKIGKATEYFFELNDYDYTGLQGLLMCSEEGDFELRDVETLLEWYSESQKEKQSITEETKENNKKTIHIEKVETLNL